MIPTFIPSKDRPAQCHALLQSLENNAPNMFSPLVVATWSNEEFANGYDKLCDRWNNKAKLQHEYTSEGQFYDFLKENADKDELIALFADDCIFYRPVDVNEGDLRSIFNNNELFSFTYRLGKNVTIKDYVINEPVIQYPKQYHVHGNSLLWDYTDVDFWQMHGFTVGFDGYIYKAKDLLELTEGKSFGSIATWERFICGEFRSKGFHKKIMGSPHISNVFVQQINITHNLGLRSNRTFNMPTSEINNWWLDGYEINLDAFEWSPLPNCTHGEKQLFFIERK